MTTNVLNVWILTDGDRPAVINGLSGDIMDNELGTPIFLSESHAETVKYLDIPNGCGCCYTTPYISFAVRPAKLTLEVL